MTDCNARETGFIALSLLWQCLLKYGAWAVVADATLPYEDNSFDVVTNAVSVDYLTRPLEVFREMHRVLKPGGQAIMSFSNRCFPTKGESTLFL